MMEGGRCGRRKQRNPKRKNVENGLDEADETALDANKNEIDNTSTYSSSGNSNHSDREDSPDCSSSHGCKSDEVEIKDKTTEEDHDNSTVSSHHDDIVKVEQDNATTVASGNEDAADEKLPVAENTEKEQTTTKPESCKTQAEEDKIQEYLSRGDTAVIFPEPVSDGEDHQNEDTEQVNNSEEEVILKCMHCIETFTRANLLRDHMRESHADKPLKFMCPKCDETFHQKSQLDKHLALHSPTSQICQVCKKTFANVYRLQRHMISHDESTDLRKFKCLECGKAFKFKHHLKEHIRIHSGEKPFECPNCSKRFSHSGSYSSHMTSKKCWVVSAHKNRTLRMEGGGDSFQGNYKISFPNNNNSKIAYQNRSPLQAVPVSHPHQQHFLPFTSRKHPIPSYFPQHVYDAPNFLPCAPFPVCTTMATHIPTISIPTLPSLKSEQAQESSKRTEPPVSPDSQSAQISPDVNSNTKLMIQNSTSGTNLHTSSSTTNVEATAERRIGTGGEKTSIAETSIKCEPADTVETSKENAMIAENVSQPTSTGDLACRFCGSQFKSPVDQHQHERYICKQNKDVVQRMTVLDPARQSPSSTMSENSHLDTTTPNGSVGTETDEDEVEEMYRESDSMTMEEKKLRIRSLISEEQLMVLKAQYIINPKPRKFELIRIGNKIGFPKRVVQVWFQNMRARDRKQGRHIKGTRSELKVEMRDRDTTKSPSYIPNVPKPFPNKLNGQNVTSALIREREYPLDLSIRRTPPEAHGGSVSRLSTPDPALDDQVLNLSMKRDPEATIIKPANEIAKTIRDTEDKPEPSQHGSFNSAIFKYMHQKGLFTNKQMSPIAHSLSPGTATKILQAQMASVLKMPAMYAMPDSASSPPSSQSTNTSSNHSFGNSFGNCIGKVNSNGSTKELSLKSENIKEEHLSNSRLVIDEDDSCSMGSPDRSQSSRDVMIDSPYGPLTSTPAHDYETDLHEDTHNLATLAEAAQQAANSLSGKPIRLRKKTWRQVESEEVQLEFDDSTSTDDDQPMKKKRKSWKNHRVDRDEGMYACDQCNKMFSKQSSLARHKYEHSGARPFACDLCTKAFKHKHHLTEHKRLHSGEKPFQCKKCGKKFSHSGSYSQHMNHRYNYCSPHKGDDGDCEMSS